MSGKVWLVVEDEYDGLVARTILNKKRISIHVEIITPTGGSGGISRLARQLEKLIASIRRNPKLNDTTDCIAILHDLDSQREQQYREHYQKIQNICDQHGIKLVIAKDELEAWLLADSGLCGWLGESPRNCDELEKPSDRLGSLLKREKRLKYQGKTRMQILEHLAGDGDNHSPSMREALQHLEDAPCTRTE